MLTDQLKTRILHPQTEEQTSWMLCTSQQHDEHNHSPQVHFNDSSWWSQGSADGYHLTPLCVSTPAHQSYNSKWMGSKEMSPSEELL